LWPVQERGSIGWDWKHEEDHQRPKKI
jgi:hypothetical protein